MVMCSVSDRFTVGSIPRNLKLLQTGVCVCRLLSKINNQLLGVADCCC